MTDFQEVALGLQHSKAPHTMGLLCNDEIGHQMSVKSYTPIAGCGAIDLPDAAEYDRRWFVVDEQGDWIPVTRCPALAAVTPVMRMGNLVLRAPGMLRLEIPMDVIEDDDSVRRTARVGDQVVDVVDEGDVAATWFCNATGVPCRLVKVHPEAVPVHWPK
jgi:uncharacterized protein YcbX